MKVLVVCSKYPPEYAGSGLRAHRTYARLKAHHAIQTEVLASSMVRMAWRNETYEVEGVRVTRVSSPFKRRLLRAMERRRRVPQALWYVLTGLDESLRTMAVLRRYRDVDLVHTFGHCWSAGVAAVWAGLTNKPIFRELVTMRSRPDDPPGLRRLVRWALRRRGTIVAISPLLAERARQLGFSRVWCRPNPVDEERFRVDRSRREALRSGQTPFGLDDVLLVELSKYAPVKNKELAVRTLAHLPARYKLVVAGPLERDDQPAYDRLQALVNTLGLHDRVVLRRGFVEHPERYLQMADVFLFPSVSDGLGTAVLEAICCGVPVVAHRLPGVTDAWIRDGENGVLCEATPEAFAQGVERAAAIPRVQLDDAARALAAHAGASAIDEAYLARLQQATGTRD